MRSDLYVAITGEIRKWGRIGYDFTVVPFEGIASTRRRPRRVLEEHHLTSIASPPEEHLVYRRVSNRHGKGHNQYLKPHAKVEGMRTL
jgi:hypothetical protein